MINPVSMETTFSPGVRNIRVQSGEVGTHHREEKLNAGIQGGPVTLYNKNGVYITGDHLGTHFDKYA